jgi:hypothetical protein
LEFAADSLFCEWAYVIDFDSNTFDVYKGFNTQPLKETDRFYFLEDKAEGNYHPVVIMASYCLDDLPTEKHFLAELKRKGW